MNGSGHPGRGDLPQELAAAGGQRSGDGITAMLGEVQHIADLAEMLVSGEGMLGRMRQARDLHAGEQQQQRRQGTASS